MRMKINIIGRGNVASHLCNALRDKADVIPVNSRTLEGFDESADVSLIAVSDNAIREVAGRLPALKGILAHTSGSVPIDILKDSHTNIGVFYPLQTFSKDVPLDYSKIPFFIEGIDKNSETILVSLARNISENVTIADSEKRKALHVASVFACNFANHLWHISDTLLKENGLTFSTILPLLEETLRKVSNVSPHDAQTGPARRHDTKVVDSHLQLLANHPDYQTIYNLLSSSISTLYQCHQ